MPPETASDFTHPVPKIEFESCEELKKTVRFCGGVIRPKGFFFFFSKHSWLNHLADLRVLKHFSKKITTYLSSFSLSFSLSSSLFFFIVSLLFSLTFSLLFSSCLFFSISSSLLLSYLFLVLCFIFSLLLHSCLLFSCLFSAVFSSLSVPVFFLCLLSVSPSRSLSVCLRVVLWSCCVVSRVVVCGVLCVVWHRENPVCPLKTCPCVPAPRAHVETHVRAVPVHTGTFLNAHTAERRRVIVSSDYQNLPTYGYHVVPEGHQK